MRHERQRVVHRVEGQGYEVQLPQRSGVGDVGAAVVGLQQPRDLESSARALRVGEVLVIPPEQIVPSVESRFCFLKINK